MFTTIVAAQYADASFLLKYNMPVYLWLQALELAEIFPH